MNKKIIFILEDQKTLSDQLEPNIREGLKNSLFEEELFESCVCSTISDAKDNFEEYKDRIACVICDANMVSIGLSPELIELSNYGLHSGWLWLCDTIENGNAWLAGRSIIYSAYRNELTRFIKNNSVYKKYESIPIVEKKSISSSESSELVKNIIKILKKDAK